jgi:beta-phosphoglucomutase
LDIKAFIFDLDGVIVDTAKFHYEAWKMIADDLGISFSEKENENLKGVGRTESLEKILQLDDRSLTRDQKESILENKNRKYLELVESLNSESCLPGAGSFLTKSQKLGIKLAIGSSSRNAMKILQKLKIGNRFQALVDGNMIDHSKPHPQVFLLCAELLRVDPKNCMVFEDAESGVQAAKNAGMWCTGIGNKDILSDANWVVPGLINLDPEQILSEEISI